jgi:hypothetical protein
VAELPVNRFLRFLWKFDLFSGFGSLKVPFRVGSLCPGRSLWSILGRRSRPSFALLIYRTCRRCRGCSRPPFRRRLQPRPSQGRRCSARRRNLGGGFTGARHQLLLCRRMNSPIPPIIFAMRSSRSLARTSASFQRSFCRSHSRSCSATKVSCFWHKIS